MIKQKLLLLAFAILGIGGFIYYEQANQSNNQIFDFISDNTLVLIETNEISTAKNSVIPRIPLLTNASSQYQILKSIGLSQRDIDLLTLKRTLYFALLAEGKDNFAFVNYLPLTADNTDFIDRLEDLSHNTTGKRIIPHTTQGYKLSEVIDEQAKSLFTYIIRDNLLIFSKSNLALEESILHSENSWIKKLKLHVSNNKSDTVFTQTHFNETSINGFLKAVSAKNSVNFSSIFPQSLTWLNPNGNVIEAISTTNSTLFEGQKASNIQGLNMIPNSASYSLIMSFSNSEKLTNQLKKDLERNKKINALRKKVADRFEVDFDNLYNKINETISLCSFDNSDQSLQNKVIIIKEKGLINPLKAIAKNVAIKQKDNVFSMQYGSFLITSLGIKEFPMVLFGEIYSGFEECYFTEYNGYIIMASNLAMMQDYLISISKGEVWSNSPKNKKILSHCLPANLTLIVENAKALKGLQRILNNKWSEKINTYENALAGIQAEILQLNATDGRLLLLKNIEIVKTVQQKTNNKWIKLGGINITSASKPMYLVNPKNKNSQILVQSIDHKLNLFDNGKRIWSYQLNNNLVGEVKSIQFLKSTSQNLIAVTKSKIFVLSRNEKGFDVTESKPFKGFNLENFNVFEYQSDKETNLTLVSENGTTFKFNKLSLILTAVNARINKGKTLVPIPNIIQKETEYVVILKNTGALFLQDSKGKIATNFPVNLKGNFVSPPLLERDNDNIVIRMISEQGDLYKVSLEGKILEKRQLFRPDNEVKFSIAVEDRNNDWVIMRTNGKEVVGLDKNEKELFVIKGLNYGKKVLGYYNLGVGGKYFSVNNGFENYRFYNENGESIGQIPVESNFKPTLSYADSYKKIIMNITTPSGIETWSVKIR